MWPLRQAVLGSIPISQAACTEPLRCAWLASIAVSSHTAWPPYLQARPSWALAGRLRRYVSPMHVKNRPDRASSTTNVGSCCIAVAGGKLRLARIVEEILHGILPRTKRVEATGPKPCCPGRAASAEPNAVTLPVKICPHARRPLLDIVGAHRILPRQPVDHFLLELLAFHLDDLHIRLERLPADRPRAGSGFTPIHSARRVR